VGGRFAAAPNRIALCATLHGRWQGVQIDIAFVTRLTAIVGPAQSAGSFDCAYKAPTTFIRRQRPPDPFNSNAQPSQRIVEHDHHAVARVAFERAA
jgi:hypothetical protein